MGANVQSLGSMRACRQRQNALPGEGGGRRKLFYFPGLIESKNCSKSLEAMACSVNLTHGVDTSSVMAPYCTWFGNVYQPYGQQRVCNNFFGLDLVC